MAYLSKNGAQALELLLKRVREFQPKFKQEALMKELGDLLDTFNNDTATIDKLRTEIKKLVDKKNDAAKQIRDRLHRMKDAVGVQYGLDSPQYDAVGRKRRSERKHPSAKPNKTS